MLRERYNDPERRLEVIHVDVEGGVFAVAKHKLVLGEAFFHHSGTVVLAEYNLLLSFPVCAVPVRQLQLKKKETISTEAILALRPSTYFRGHRASDLKVYVHVSLCRGVLEVNPSEVTVVGFGQVKCKLVVNGQFV